MDPIALVLPESFQELGVTLLTAGLGMAWNVVAAFAVFVFGFFAAGFFTRFLGNVLKRAHLDATLISFFTNLLYYGLVALVVITALSRLGVETTQFIAIVGAAGLAVGLALEGALSNFAAGVLIIVFRPFRVGDYIEAADSQGYVEAIEMVHTVLRTVENQVVIIPNSEVTGGKIKNLSRNDHVALEIPFYVSHDADLDTVLRILIDAAADNPHVLPQPAPRVAVTQLDRDGVHVELDVPIRGGDHEDAQYRIVEKVKRAFDAAGIAPPRQLLAFDVPKARAS